MGLVEQAKSKRMLESFCAAQLKSEKCQCGRSKQRGMAVCYLCWGLLPRSVRNALYRPVGDGFEAALCEAWQLLACVPYRCADAPEWPQPALLLRYGQAI